jgi:hypothetical protein
VDFWVAAYLALGCQGWFVFLVVIGCLMLCFSDIEFRAVVKPVWSCFVCVFYIPEGLEKCYILDLVILG